MEEMSELIRINQTQTKKGGGGYGTLQIYARLRLTQIFF